MEQDNPLIQAIEQCHKESIQQNNAFYISRDCKKLICDPKQYVNQKSIDGKTPLELAYQYNLPEIIEQIIKSNQLDLTQTDSQQFSPLHRAIQSKDFVSINLILERDDLNYYHLCEIPETHTPLELAIDSNSLSDQSVYSLVKSDKVDINQIFRSYKNILQLAIEADNHQLLKLIVRRQEVDLQAPFQNPKVTPLRFAVLSNRVELCKILFQRKSVGIDDTDRDGNTALHLAVYKDQVEVCRAIINFYHEESNISIPNKKGKTARDVAIELYGKDSEIYKIFQQSEHNKYYTHFGNNQRIKKNDIYGQPIGKGHAGRVKRIENENVINLVCNIVGGQIEQDDTGRQLLNGRPVAVKIVKKSNIEDQEQLNREYEHLLKLRSHPNIIQLYCKGESTEYYYFFMECCDCTLQQAITNSTQKQWFVKDKQLQPLSIEVARQICEGVKHLHDQGYLHRDIKPLNILLVEECFINYQFEKGLAKICDMGIAIKFDHQSYKYTVIGGTQDYQPPEVKDIKNRKQGRFRYERSTDIYSLGCVIFFIISQGGTFDYDLNYDKIQNKVGLQGVKNKTQGHYTILGLDLLNKMICEKSQRCGIDEVLDHPFFKTLEEQYDFLVDKYYFMWNLKPTSEKLTSEHKKIVDEINGLGKEIFGPKGWFFNVSTNFEQWASRRSKKYGENNVCCLLFTLRNILKHEQVDNIQLLQEVGIYDATRTTKDPLKNEEEQSKYKQIVMRFYTGLFPNFLPKIYNYFRGPVVNEYSRKNYKPNLSELSDDLFKLYQKSSIQNIYQVLESSNQIDLQDSQGNTLLHVASDKGEQSICLEIIKNQHSLIEQSNSDGKLPLHFAAKNGSFTICQLLITKMSRVDVEDQNNDIPLHIASNYGKYRVVEYLLEQGNSLQQINWQNKNKDTPLILAAKGNYIEVCELLITKGSSLDVVDSKKNTILHIAAKSGRLEPVELIIQKAEYLVRKQNDQQELPVQVAHNQKVKEYLQHVMGIVDTIDFKDYQVITKGQLCTVYRDKKNIQRVIKHFKQDPFLQSEISVIQLQDLEESRASQQNTHQNVVNILGFSKNIDGDNYIQMEKCDKTLVEHLNNPDILDTIDKIQLAYQIAKGVFYLHSKNIVHQAIRPENILIKDGIAKVSCFSVSTRMISEHFGSENETIINEWIAPEQIEIAQAQGKIQYSFQSDVYSLGLVLFYIFSNGQHPRGYNQAQRLENVKQNEIDWFLLQNVFNDEAKFRELYYLLKECLKRQDRQSIIEVLSSPLFWSDLDKSVFLCDVANALSTIQIEPLQFEIIHIINSQSNEVFNKYKGWRIEFDNFLQTTRARKFQKFKKQERYGENLKELIKFFSNIQLYKPNFLCLENYPPNTLNDEDIFRIFQTKFPNLVVCIYNLCKSDQVISGVESIQVALERASKLQIIN